MVPFRWLHYKIHEEELIKLVGLTVDCHRDLEIRMRSEVFDECFS